MTTPQPGWNHEPETGESGLAVILQRHGLIVRPYTYQGTARILRAMRDVAAILDKHGAPPGEAVHFGAAGDPR